MDEDFDNRCNCLIMKKSDLTFAFLFRILYIGTNKNREIMPTILTKDITREALLASDMQGRKLIVTLKGGDMVSFRPKGRRIRYEVPLLACYNMAIIYSAHEWHRERMKIYLEKKKAGYRVRKPRRLPRIFNQKYYEALKMT